MFIAVHFNDWVKLIYWPVSQHVFQFFNNLKAEYGVWYAVISTSIFGSLLPFLFLSDEMRLLPFTLLFFYIILWAVLGGLVNRFYGLQAMLFGEDTDWLTILKKTALN